MKKRLHILLILCTAVIIFLLYLVFFLYTINLTVKQTEGQGFDDIAQIYQDIKQTPAELLDYQQIALEQAKIIPAHIIIVDGDSYLLADSHKQIGDISGKYINADISDAKRMSAASSTLRDHQSNGLMVSVAQKFDVDEDSIIISLVYRINEVQRLMAGFLLFAGGITLLLTGLVILIVTYALKRYQKPIRKLLQHTKKAARGGFYKISVETGNAELTQLVDDFNALMDRYDLLIESDNKKYSKINTLLAHLHTGILMVDPQNTITLVNPQAERLLRLNKLKLFKDAADNTYLNELLSRILAETMKVNSDKRNRSLSLTTDDGQIIDISIEVMFSKYIPYGHSGALVILRDVTEMRRLERLKDEFVSNVSHELRTPLTVINGFVETLKSWDLLDDADRITALNIIDVETERLKKLISELLLLSRIEGQMSGASKEYIDPVALVQEVVESLHSLGEERHIETQMVLGDEIAPVYGIESWFRQIVFNLYDNAIKYSQDGGVVTIRLFNDDSSLILEVEDHGVGISQEDQQRIFERFYRVDKSRSSRIPGSGLGLAITKLMVTEFQGTIDVESRIGRGTTFRVVIPQTI